MLRCFAAGEGFRKAARLRHAAGLTWRSARVNPTLGAEETLLEAALHARLFRRAGPHAANRNMSPFYRCLSEASLESWPQDDHFKRGALCLVAALLAEAVPPDSAVVAPLVHQALLAGPLLPQLVGMAHELDQCRVSWKPELKDRRQALMGRWLARMGQSPEGSWVAQRKGTEHGPLGCRAPSAQAAFFRQEALAACPHGQPVFWEALALVAPHMLLELAAPLETLAPPEEVPELYTTPGAALGLLDLMSSGTQGAARVGPLMQRAWACGWRPALPETSLATRASWSRLGFMHPKWTAWLAERSLDQAIAVAPDASISVRPRL